MNGSWQAVQAFLSRPLLGIPLGQWLAFLVLVLVLYLVLLVLTRVLTPRLRARAARTHTPYDDYLTHLLERTYSFGLLGAALLAALAVVPLMGPYGMADRLRPLGLVLLFVQVGLWGNAFIDTLLERGFRAAAVGETAARTAAGVVRWFALVILWGAVVLLVLGAWNIEITPLVAGLGVTGIAVAFALQQILGDVFCSVAIVMDRPFEVGDFIAVGDFMGAVEHIGIKTTRLRSLDGEQIIFPNSDLIGSRIRNYKRMLERRVVFGFGVLYSTPVDALGQIPGLVRDIIRKIDRTRFDRAHFHKFGDSALELEVVYYVLSADFNLYMDIQQQINLELLGSLQELGVEMAFPSRTIYLDRETGALLGRLGSGEKGDGEPGA